MKTSASLLAVIVTISTLSLSCNANKSASAPSATTGNSAVVVAEVNGAPITDADLTTAAKDQLKQFDMQVYKIKKSTLDDLIESKLIAEAAQKAGKSAEEYIKINIDDKIKKPSDDELKAFYESHKDQVGGKNFDEVKVSITQYLSQRSSAEARNTVLAQLKKDAKVQINLEPPRVTVEAGNNPSIGPKGAPIELIEFTDYECPFCTRARPTVTALLEKYKDKIHYTLRDYPLPFHGNAKKAHEAAHCAGEQGKYWEMNKILFKDSKALQVDKLKGYAKELGLNTAKFDKCLDSGKFGKKVDENQAYGSSIGVNGTPAFFINGIALSGAQPVENFTVIIDAELAKQN